MSENQDTENTARRSASVCSPLVIEALERCAQLDEGWARAARFDAEKCKAHDSATIRARAEGLLIRAQHYEGKAAAYRAAMTENGMDEGRRTQDIAPATDKL